MRPLACRRTTTAADPSDPNTKNAYLNTGYVNAARGEVEEARPSGNIMLAIVDRYAAILHHPLTFTLAEASRRLLTEERGGTSRPVRRLLTEARGGTPRPVPETARIALANARYMVGYARPEEPGGGWSSFGNDMLATFAATAAACRENRVPSSDQRTQLP